MKRWLCMFLALTLCLPLMGCAPEPNDIADPVSFYYRRSADSISYGMADGVISAEQREAYGHRDDPAYLINLYLKGPAGTGMNRTFPKGVELVKFSLEGGCAYITVSDFFSTLTGINLTLACACLTLTVCELTGAKQLTVSTSNTLLDGNRPVIMTPDDILFLDENTIVVDPA